MGQQQLLLIILGVIVVGIAVAVGITMFTDNAVNANRDAVTNDLVNLSARAQQFYRRPTALGGGGNSFVGLTLANLTNRPTNANGTYSITTVGTATGLEITGVGTEMAVGTTPVTMRIKVSNTVADSVFVVY
jgi:Tfp pilus assembly protein PilE